MTSRCLACKAGVGAADWYCGACGKPLAVLQWLGPGGEWRDGDAQAVVAQGSRSAVVMLRNGGGGPLSAVLTAQDESVPPWVDLAGTRDVVLELEPGQERRLELPILELAFSRLFGPHQRTAREAELVDLTMVTSLATTREVGWEPARLTLRLLVAREPRIVPRFSHYAFLPLERLRGPGVLHSVLFTNDTADPLEIVACRAEDILRPDGVGQGISCEQMATIVQAPRPGDVLQPRTERTVEVLLHLAEEVSVDGDAWAAFEVQVQFRRAGAAREATREIGAEISAFVGAGPDLQVNGCRGRAAVDFDASAADISEDLSLTNPGVLPLRVTDLRLLRPDGSVVLGGAPDWLEVSIGACPFVIGAGETRSVPVRTRSRHRTELELRSETLARRLEIRHDGLPDTSGERRTFVDLRARFPRTRVDHRIFLGIDFGTSNSAVCLLADEGRWSALKLDPPSENLASLLFYDPRRLYATDAPSYVVGTAARNVAQTEPANLVRNVKAIISRDPSYVFNFHDREPGGRVTFREVSSRELLNTFIQILRARSESSLFHLPAELLRAVMQGAERVHFTQAVFTHPVEVQEGALQALMDAAQSASLARTATSSTAFAKDFCTDEATAAVLAYVYQAVGQELRNQSGPPLDEERLVCFDLGGGTTDVAAVEILGMSAFASGATEAVEVTLCATGGCVGAGGSDVDTEVALFLARQVVEQAARTGAPIQLDEVEHALRSGSLGEYRRAWEQRRAAIGPLGVGPRDDPAYEIYARAVELRQQAEQAKCRLNREERVTLQLPGSGWPHAPQVRSDSAANFEVSIAVADLPGLVDRMVDRQCDTVRRVVADAGWTLDGITTLLFTGQGARLGYVRKRVLDCLRDGRSGSAGPRVIEPDDGSGFDPKNCVALGAAVWGMSRHQEGGWLRVRRRRDTELTFTAQTQVAGRIFRDIQGLERGTTFPARVRVRREAAVCDFRVFRNRAKFVEFQWPRPVSDFEIEVQSSTAWFAIIEGERYSGEIVT